MFDGSAAARIRHAVRWARGVGAVLLFLLSVQLLKSAIGDLAPHLQPILSRLVQSDLSALGVSWLAAYVLLNGSVVAALALTLFNASLVSTSQLTLMVFGSRLGAAAIVLLIGVFDFVQRRRLTVRKATELGVITFLVTHTIGLPAAVVGALWGRAAPLGWIPEGARGSVRHLRMPSLIEGAVHTVVGHVGPLLGVIGAVLLLVGSLRLFGAVFEEDDVDRIRTRARALLSNRWAAFGIGIGGTALTTSVAFSLGVIVPIYNRGYLQRAEVTPYILGANIGTLLDTLLISLFVEVAGGFEVSILVMAATALVSLPALLFLRVYQAGLDAVLARLLAGRGAFLAFLASLVLAPLGLVGLGWGVG